ncbi:hypothetical protein D8I35_03275 [Corticibacter populi]|uniref:Uncharacterized protein n=1 Tax=Corticibacter populi TaxID=1550736 RepID=A0A3M6QZ27_9BURK|nr:hypothetical protein [Corticibacter populi]RMX08153.1 hypothetical protein D8I35_03275 [Corticibacter populi]RZS35413.1 hypothetical protein EV687_0478 [Corticibacter populi]
MNTLSHSPIRRRLAKPAFGWLGYLFIGLAIAATVTAAQVADAIRNSSTASAWLKDNADAVGRLAMFESSGRTDIYNGSCCYGVLQMNTANIRASGYTTAEFQQLSLQDQVNAWSTIMSSALATRNPNTLAGMDTFDGRPVTGDLVLACVQLGIGNCGSMIRSGSCSGFADRNGTTICDMADHIAGNASGSTASGASSSTNGIGAGYGGSAFSGTYDGNFDTGSGVDSAKLKLYLQMALLSLTAMVIAGAMINSWRGYSRGALTLPEFKQVIFMGTIAISFVACVGTFL